MAAFDGVVKELLIVKLIFRILDFEETLEISSNSSPAHTSPRDKKSSVS